MLTLGPRMILVVLLLLVVGGGAVRTDSAPIESARIDTAPLEAVSQPVATRAVKGKAHCHGISHREVRGEEPTYTRKQLARFPNRNRLCHGIWLPSPRRYLVPQGIAITGNTAWLSGFRYRKGYGNRPCQLVRVDLTTGRRLAFRRAIYGQVGQRPRTYCRHGGGILQRGRLLWIVEKNKLWLVNPLRPGRVLNARRVWRIKSPVRGSAVVATPQRIGLVPFQTRGVAQIHWFTFKRLMRTGVLDLAVRRKGARQLGAVARTHIPSFVQGATTDARGRLFLARSTLACGELVTPAGRRIAFVPGAEGIALHSGDRRLWAVSESGAWPYARSRKPLTAAVSSFEWPRLRSGKHARCGFPVS